MQEKLKSDAMQIQISFAAAYDFNQYTQYVPCLGPSQLWSAFLYGVGEGVENICNYHHHHQRHHRLVLRGVVV